jgi:GTP-binding protein HflX
MYGLGKTKLSRQGGGVGTRGKGETNIEFERRQIKKEQQKIAEKLKKIQTQKQNRIQRRNDRGIGPVALVGYTSAGKTTLFNELTGKEKEEHRKLFTTLDTVVGKMKSSYFSQPVLVSDTIGFIQNLPPVLVDSFKSTLLESLEAELILHVVDVSDQHLLQKMAVVDEILDSLAADQSKILVLNKHDLISDEEVEKIESKINAYLEQRLESKREESPEATNDYTAVQFVSAKTGEGVGALKEVIEGFFEESGRF